MIIKTDDIPRLQTTWAQCECNSPRGVAIPDCPNCGGRGIVPAGKRLGRVYRSFKITDYDNEDYIFTRPPLGEGWDY